MGPRQSNSLCQLESLFCFPQIGMLLVVRGLYVTYVCSILALVDFMHLLQKWTRIDYKNVHVNKMRFRPTCPSTFAFSIQRSNLSGVVIHEINNFIQQKCEEATFTLLFWVLRKQTVSRKHFREWKMNWILVESEYLHFLEPVLQLLSFLVVLSIPAPNLRKNDKIQNMSNGNKNNDK